MVREQFIAQNRPAGKPAPDMSVTLSGLKLDNPVVPASGTFGYGNEFRDFYDINILGSFSFKGGQLSFEERMGCGFGACMGCSCKTKYGNKRICKEGPVLTKGEIIW